MRSALLLMIVTFFGCNEPGPPRLNYHKECTPEQTEKLSTWILECIKNANPLSDEDPEDWISQCERTGKRILCGKIAVVEYQPCGGCSWTSVSCATITDPQLKSICP